jgi:type I restriction enzyme M protein
VTFPNLFALCTPASETPWTKELWIYDFRTNMDFSLKTKQLVRADLDDFVACFHADNRFERKATWSPESEAGRAAAAA